MTVEILQDDLFPSKEEMIELEKRDYEYDEQTDILARWLYEGNVADEDFFEKCAKVCHECLD